MSSKQLARTAIDGRKITLHVTAYTGSPVRGYLCGMDDFHLLVVESDGDVVLLHKGSVSAIDLSGDMSYQDEPIREELEKLVGPFRAAVQKDHLAPTTKAQKERLAAS